MEKPRWRLSLIRWTLLSSVSSRKAPWPGNCRRQHWIGSWPSLKVPARVWKAAWAGLLEADLTPDLTRITAPTLIVWGERDDMALRAEQEILLRSIPNVRFLIFEGAGHAPHWEEPERFASVVADFVNDRSGSYSRLRSGPVTVAAT
nr:alpha/beta hydrolase [Microvirga tunisiensis]